jgi:hypothetical protein
VCALVCENTHMYKLPAPQVKRSPSSVTAAECRPPQAAISTVLPLVRRSSSGSSRSGCRHRSLEPKRIQRSHGTLGTQHASRSAAVMQPLRESAASSPSLTTRTTARSSPGTCWSGHTLEPSRQIPPGAAFTSTRRGTVLSSPEPCPSWPPSPQLPNNPTKRRACLSITGTPAPCGSITLQSCNVPTPRSRAPQSS